MTGMTKKTRRGNNRSRLNKWARGIGELTANTEILITNAEAEFEARVRDLRGREQRVLKKLADQHQANHRALKELRAGLRRASAELNHAYRSAIRQLRSRNARKSTRAAAR